MRRGFESRREPVYTTFFIAHCITVGTFSLAYYHGLLTGSDQSDTLGLQILVLVALSDSASTDTLTHLVTEGIVLGVTCRFSCTG